jgi:hypothetical protein
MPFFQNPFADEFRGNWLLGDRQYVPTFVLPGNAGRGKEMVQSWNRGPFNLSGNDSDGNATNILNIHFSLHNPKNWATLQVNISAGAVSSSAVTAAEVAAALAANTVFNERFTASYDLAHATVKITQRKPVTEFLFYIGNGQGDSVLGFNARAGIAEMPSYFSRHTIANRFIYADSEGKIIELEPGSVNVDAELIDAAVNARGVSLGYDSSTVQADWQLLGGKSGIFNFQKITVDGSNRITLIIEYPAGAIAGDLGRKIAYTYTGGNTNPSQITEIPYTLTSGDLITP